jgi:hypothetical protein
MNVGAWLSAWSIVCFTYDRHLATHGRLLKSARRMCYIAYADMRGFPINNGTAKIIIVMGLVPALALNAIVVSGTGLVEQDISVNITDDSFMYNISTQVSSEHSPDVFCNVLDEYAWVSVHAF